VRVEPLVQEAGEDLVVDVPDVGGCPISVERGHEDLLGVQLLWRLKEDLVLQDLLHALGQL
jgi:hypothetical protein